MSDHPAIDTQAVNSDFPSHYKETVFLAWYNSGRISIRRLHKSIEPSEDGRKPSVHTLQVWYDSEGWPARADSMDADVAKEIERAAIEEKVAMIRRHAETAKRLIEMGKDYLEEHKIDKSADAIRAIIQGMEAERVSRGLQIALGEISRLSDNDLLNFIQKRIEAASAVGETINRDVVDGEVRDIDAESG